VITDFNIPDFNIPTTYSYSEDQTCSRTFCKHFHNVDENVCVVTAGSAQVIWNTDSPNDCGIEVSFGGEVLCTEDCGSSSGIMRSWFAWLIAPVISAAIYWCWMYFRTKRGDNDAAGADNGRAKQET
jgi:hypothetical protein